jgi:hypothetical protein
MLNADFSSLNGIAGDAALHSRLTKKAPIKKACDGVFFLAYTQRPLLVGAIRSGVACPYSCLPS